MKIIIEKHPDDYVAYPADIEGIVVGQGTMKRRRMSKAPFVFTLKRLAFADDDFTRCV